MAFMFPKGHVFEGPDGSGYRLVRDVLEGDELRAPDFEAFGGAPEPKAGEAMAEWLAQAVKRSPRAT